MQTFYVMKKSVFLILSLLLSLELSAQLPVQNLNVTRQNDLVSVSFRIVVPKNYIKRDYKETITPILFNSENAMALPPVYIAGKNKIKREKQEQALSGKETFIENSYLTNGSTLDYSATFPYQPWMKNVLLGADTEMKGCCRTIPGDRFLLAENIVLKEDFIPYFSPYVSKASVTEQLNEPFILPMSEYGKKVKNSLRVYFPQSIANVETSYMDNATTLSRIGKAIKTIQNDPVITMKKAVITGFASPEGVPAFNEKLSGERAKALEQYLTSHYQLSPVLFDLTNGGIDWDGLQDAAGSSGYSWKSSIQDIIQQTPENGRLAKLKSLDDGVPYRTMYNEIFPKLRNAVNIAFYYEKDDTLLKKRTELFNLVKNGEYGKALPQLLTLPQDGWSSNMTGVCYQMTGDSDKAWEYFNKAVSMGDSEAAKNLKQLNRP